MKLDAGVDTGPILSQRSIPIDPHETAGSLFKKLAVLGGELLMATLPDYLDGKIIPQPQDGNLVLMPPCLKKKMVCWIFSNRRRSWSGGCVLITPGRAHIS